MLDYTALATLAEILRRGSFEAAAGALCVTPSAVSQRLKALEGRMGQVLVHRGPPLRPTEAGMRLVAHLDQVRLMEAQLDLAGTPVVRVAVNANSLAAWAMPALAAVPGLVDLVIDDQDHTEARLRQGTLAAAITSQPGPVAGCDSHPLGAMRYIASASPDFIARHFADGVTARALGAAPSLCYDHKDALQDRWALRELGHAPGLPRHMIPQAQAFAQAARLGMGWGMNPEALIAADLAAGRLRPIGANPVLDVPLYWQIARITAPALAPLTRAIRRAASTALYRH